MKSRDLRATEATKKQSEVWLSDMQEKTRDGLDAAFRGQRLKKRADLSIAFALGLLLATLAHLVSIVSVLYATWTLGIVTTIGVLVSLAYMRAAARAIESGNSYIRAASSTIKIVADEDLPIEKPPAPPSVESRAAEPR